MDKASALELLNQMEWDKYKAPKFYDPIAAKEVMLKLISITDPRDHPDICHEVQSTIGNDHGGTYYPIVFDLLDFLMLLEAGFVHKAVRDASYAILNNISYFQLECDDLNEEIATLDMDLKTKLARYRDEEDTPIV